METIQQVAERYATKGGAALILNNVFRSCLEMADNEMDGLGPIGVASPENSRKHVDDTASEQYMEPDAQYEDHRFINFQFMMHQLGRIAEKRTISIVLVLPVVIKVCTSLLP